MDGGFDVFRGPIVSKPGDLTENNFEIFHQNNY